MRGSALKKAPFNQPAANKPAQLDLQFMPEGGNLVNLLPFRIAFKAIGPDGLSVSIKGTITDKENNTQARFQASHKGMGYFDLVPQPGESYTANVTLPGGETRSVPLPAAASSGTSLKIQNIPGQDSLLVLVAATPQMLNKSYSLIGMARESVYYAGTFILKKDLLTLRIAKSLFPSGISHFTLFNDQNRPVNERIVFIDHHDNLVPEISLGSSSYAPRDSISLQVTVKDEKANPVTGSFSVAVTDDSQIAENAIFRENICSQLFLSSELKGYIEEPAYYFTGDRKAADDLDILLLCQGWTGYDWKEIFNDETTINYAAEPPFEIRGKIDYTQGKQSPATISLLETGKDKFYKDTTTDKDGNFVFRNLPPTDSAVYVFQARNAKGKLINAGITIQENKEPATDPRSLPLAYIPDDSTLNIFNRQSRNYHNEQEKLRLGPGVHELQTVIVKDKAIVKGSKNLNGAGSYNQLITSDEIEKSGQASLYQLITQKVNGFHEGHFHKNTSLTFLIREKQVHFVIDGVDLEQFYQPDDTNPNGRYDYLRQTLDYLTAPDITGIEVIYTLQYNALYNGRYLTTQAAIAGGNNIAYLEITTRSGNGPFTNSARGVLVYRPTVLATVARFYRPKYPIGSNQSAIPDLRSTIHWAPDVITDKNGRATIFFYAADHPGTYTVILQGADLKRKVGFAIQKISIKKRVSGDAAH